MKVRAVQINIDGEGLGTISGVFITKKSKKKAQLSYQVVFHETGTVGYYPIEEAIAEILKYEHRNLKVGE